MTVWFVRAGDYTSYSYMVDYFLGVPRPRRLPPIRNFLFPMQNVVWSLLAGAVVTLAATFALFALVAGKGVHDIMGQDEERQCACA